MAAGAAAAIAVRKFRNVRTRNELTIPIVSQALDRTQPLLPIEFNSCEKRTHDYVRHGTTILLVALNLATACACGHRPLR
ncbi:hypothetical protein FDG2_0547 [Candidatus Protofrankia californiensis]|uniref:Uncharacterized protein n=1 Tax=Candidatus Protofrankia californiensis TaxID=1839754 RepID=A0A1C3NTQ7_9ACTN|nr:hypothetical protein FDG2_0547 [Candidatus Protofrankia californiensis]